MLVALGLLGLIGSRNVFVENLLASLGLQSIRESAARHMSAVSIALGAIATYLVRGEASLMQFGTKMHYWGALRIAFGVLAAFFTH